jgi:hypothetical protein
VCYKHYCHKHYCHKHCHEHYCYKHYCLEHGSRSRDSRYVTILNGLKPIDIVCRGVLISCDT